MIPQGPPNNKLACGCLVHPGLGGAIVIDAISFLCDEGHRQDDLVPMVWDEQGQRWTLKNPAGSREGSQQ